MICSKQPDLSAFVDESLSDAQMRAVREHLKTCAECRTVEALIRRTTKPMDTSELEGADDARERVRRSFEEQTSLLFQLGQFFRKKDKDPRK